MINPCRVLVVRVGIALLLLLLAPCRSFVSPCGRPLLRENDVTFTPERPWPSAATERSWLLKSVSDCDDPPEPSSVLAESDQAILGIVGCVAAFVTLCSESVLKATGCGLPAGPFGLVGAVEGLSYLGIVGMGALSLVTKYNTGKGLPSGPGGLLGAAEGLSFLAIFAGIVVLILQVTNYGYIPNAVPMEGGMCS